MLSSMLRIGCGAAPPISNWGTVKPPPVVRRARRCWTSTTRASQTGAYSRGGPFVDVVSKRVWLAALAAAIRRTHPDVKVLCFTGFGDDLFKEKGSETSSRTL